MTTTTATTEYAQTIMQRAEILGGISEDAACLTRRFGTPSMAEANRAVAGWMLQAGMSVRQDNIGNIIGRYEAAQRTDGSTPSTMIIGSHLDTVRDAGKYDGPLGVLVGIACVQALHDSGRRLPFAIEVVGFADEEGLRYGTSYLGSKVFAGCFPSEYGELRDDDDVALASAITAFGGDISACNNDKRSPDDLLGYCEVHIEQGPVLEHENLPVGIVSAISGQTRARLAFMGMSGHAGTVPMSMRHDALCAAAEFVLAVESLAQQTSGLVATVGQLTVQPGAGNVIPGHATLSLDVRHIDNDIRLDMYNRLRKQAEAISERRALTFDWQLMQDNISTPCSPQFAAKLAHAVEAAGYPVRHLASGAGHDGVIMSGLCSFGMLFVRCKGGVSHNPSESVMVEDVAVAIDVMNRFLEDFDAAV
ncbi:MAG: allantoate amidohydrolase [Chloroflexota bacterium]